MTKHKAKGPDSKTTNDDFLTTGSEHLSQDINTDEALSASNATFNSISQMNLKRTYDLHQTLDTDAILAARKQSDAEASMRLRHAEEEHHQKMRHENDLHTIRVQTMAVAAVGGNRIVEQIANDTADQIVAYAKTKLGK